MNPVSDYLPTDNAEHWAVGCDKCKFGIAIAPELTRSCPLHLERLAQFIKSEIVFCDCQAGSRYKVYLLNLKQRLIEEARKDPRMIVWAAKSSHPEIEWALGKITDRTEYVPTIHVA
jgi:hypothetical protein